MPNSYVIHKKSITIYQTLLGNSYKNHWNVAKPFGNSYENHENVTNPIR